MRYKVNHIIMRSLLVIFVYFIGICLIKAQESPEYLPKIGIPSPSAFKFSTYGNLPLNSSTGAFNFSVPLYTIEHGDITMPISVDYFSNGVKIDELAGVVGTDWNLNVGGVVSRIVRGVPDDRAQERWYPETIHTNIDYIKIKNAANDSGMMGTTSIDTEQDWFSFNVNGLSGSFHFDENLEPQVNGKDFVKIKFEQHINSTDGYGRHSSFIINDNQGYTYIFGGSIEYLEGNIGSRNCTIIDNPKDHYYSTWYLREIISPTNQKITFSYKENLFNYISGISFSLVYEEKCLCEEDDPNIPDVYIRNYTPCLYQNTLRSRVISQIDFGDNSIHFDYNTQRLDHGGFSLKDIKVKHKNENIKEVSFLYDMVYTNIGNTYFKLNGSNLKYRLFLQDIIFKSDGVNQEEQKYTFSYNNKELLPIRLSFSKDRFGYFNNRSNMYPISKDNVSEELLNIINKYHDNYLTSANLEVDPNYVYFGMLENITYPTKGSTQIIYEANSNVNFKEEEAYTNGYIEIRKTCNENSPKKESFNFISNGSKLIITSVNTALGIDGCGGDVPIPDPLHDKWRVVVKDLSIEDPFNQIVFTKNGDYGEYIEIDPNLTCSTSNPNRPICTIEGHEYEITFFLLSKPHNPAEGLLTFSYNASTTIVEKPFYGGGARVKEISDYTNENQANKRSFYYNKINEYPSNETTLNQFNNPKYYELFQYNKATFCQIECNCNDKMGADADACRIFTLMNNNIPKKRYEITSSTMFNLYNNRKQQSYYTSITEFHENESEINGAIERIFLLADDAQSNPILLPEIHQTPYSNSGDSKYGLLREENTYKNGGNNTFILTTKKEIEYKSFNTTPLKSYTFRKNFDVLMMPVPENYLDNISASEYYNFIDHQKVKRISGTNIETSGDLITETIFEYGALPYSQLVKESNIESNGCEKTTLYKYPPDLLGIEQTTLMQELVDSNRIAQPVITKTIGGCDKHELEKHIKYGKNQNTSGLILPIESHIKKGLSQIDINTAEDRKIRYTKYDSNGNILEYILENGIPVSIIWGYDNKYPIAKIEGREYSSISVQLVESLQNSSNNGTLNDQSFYDLRNAIFTDITTYTYEPLVGLKTITQPNGITNYYEYDSFGRLILVKDTDENVIQKIEYNFKQ